MTTDNEAAAVEYTVIRPDGTHYRTDEGGARMAAKRDGYRVLQPAAIAAHTAASAGEVVAHRGMLHGSPVGAWIDGAPHPGTVLTEGYSIKYAYAHPPAAVPADALRELVDQAMSRAQVFDDGSDGADAESAQSVMAILKQIAALIPKGAV